jgi:hypothetical protein
MTDSSRAAKQGAVMVITAEALSVSGQVKMLDERFEFRDRLVLGLGSWEHKEALLEKTDQADRPE